MVIVVQEVQTKKDKPAYDINKWLFTKSDIKEDELIRYLKAQVLILDVNEEFDILKWWKGNSKEYPILCHMALDVFSIPAMSVEPERVFSESVLFNAKLTSSCKLTLTDGRNKLKTDAVEAVECL